LEEENCPFAGALIIYYWREELEKSERYHP
jgi:hypothetical protein